MADPELEFSTDFAVLAGSALLSTAATVMCLFGKKALKAGRLRAGSVSLPEEDEAAVGMNENPMSTLARNMTLAPSNGLTSGREMSIGTARRISGYEKVNDAAAATTHPPNVDVSPDEGEITYSAIAVDKSSYEGGHGSEIDENSASAAYAVVAPRAVREGTMTSKPAFGNSMKKDQHAAPEYSESLPTRNTSAQSNKKTVDTSLTSSSFTRDIYGNSDVILDTFVVAAADVALGADIDAGQYGKVCDAVWNGQTVAVKTIKLDGMITEDQEASFLKEMSTMAQLQHERVLQLLCVTKDPIMIVMERVSERSLLSYIEERGFTEASPLPLPTLLEFASHAAAGLKYLTEHGIVHRDVAARNILLDVKGTRDFSCKVADFGLCGLVQQFYDGSPVQAAKKVPIPVRWTAIEAVSQNQWTSKSDVWSFAIMVWELTTNGQFPYTLHWEDRKACQSIRAGLRPHQATLVPDQLYSLLHKCWHQNPYERIAFDEVVAEIEVLRQELAPPPMDADESAMYGHLLIDEATSTGMRTLALEPGSKDGEFLMHFMHAAAPVFVTDDCYECRDADKYLKFFSEGEDPVYVPVSDPQTAAYGAGGVQCRREIQPERAVYVPFVPGSDLIPRTVGLVRRRRTEVDLPTAFAKQRRQLYALPTVVNLSDTSKKVRAPRHLPSSPPRSKASDATPPIQRDAYRCTADVLPTGSDRIITHEARRPSNRLADLRRAEVVQQDRLYQNFEGDNIDSGDRAETGDESESPSLLPRQYTNKEIQLPSVRSKAERKYQNNDVSAVVQSAKSKIVDSPGSAEALLSQETLLPDYSNTGSGYENDHVSSDAIAPAERALVRTWIDKNPSREECEVQLKIGSRSIKDTYLIRKSGSNPGDYVLSLAYNQKFKHYRLETVVKGQVDRPVKLCSTVMESVQFDSLWHLIWFHKNFASKGLPVKLGMCCSYNSDDDL